ncbi:MAG: CAP domain-containing protein [Gemmatimonadaceae bacterium]
MKNSVLAVLAILPVVIAQGCASSSSAPVMQQGGPTALPGANFVALERGVIDELNLARTDPQRYAASLEQDLQFYQGTLFRRPGEESALQTREGVAAVREAIRVLRQTKPLSSLRLAEGLTQGARDHVKDQAPRGLMNHRGTDGTMAWDRVSRYGEWQAKISENMTFGPATPHDVVAALLIDDGIADRGHRKNILDPDVKVVGISCGPHKSYRVMCDMVHAGGFVAGK